MSDVIFNEMLVFGYGNVDGVIELISVDLLMVWNIF